MNLPNRPKRPLWKQVAAFAFVAALIGAFWLRRGQEEEAPELLRAAGTAFSTIYSVKVVAAEHAPGAGDELSRRIDEATAFVDDAMSRFKDDSELARFNRYSGDEPFVVSKETAALLARSREVSDATGGAFDVTVGPLIKLWGFYGKQGRGERPTDEEIGAARGKVGYRALEIDSAAATLVKTNPELHVDLSAVAKGYAVDRIAFAVEEMGYRDYLVEIGGEIRARGRNPKGRVWRIGIEKPVPGTRETYQIISLADASVATSGDYRNFYELDGKTMSHTVDPRTGWPVAHGLASVSVVHPECAVADAYATGLTVLGPEAGYALALERGLAALFITREEGGMLVSRATPGFERVSVSRANTGRAEEGK